MPYAGAMPLTRPPIDFDAVRAALWRVVQAATGLGPNSVVASQPEAPLAKRPETPFCEFMVSTVAQAFGRDAEAPTDVEGVYKYYGPRLMTVQFQTYGETHEQAYGIASTLHAAFGIDTYLDLLRAAGVVVWSRAAVTDLSALLSTGYEGRAAFNVSFGLHSSLTVDVGIVTSVPVSSTIAAEQTLTLSNFTVDLREG